MLENISNLLWIRSEGGTTGNLFLFNLPNIKSDTFIRLAEYSLSSLTGITDEFLNAVLCYLVSDYLKLFPSNCLFCCYLFIQVAFISTRFYLLLIVLFGPNQAILESTNGCLGNRIHIISSVGMVWNKWPDLCYQSSTQTKTCKKN